MVVIRLGLVLWEVMLVMFSTYDQTKLSSGFRSGVAGARERRIQSRSTCSDAKPGSLWTCGPALIPAATPRVCHLLHQGITTLFQHIQVHLGIDFQADFEDVRWHDMALTWNNTKDHNRSRKLYFHYPGHVPVIRGSPDLHFESAGNGPVVITGIGREHELYNGASPILLVQHCVAFRHDRRLLSLLGFVHNRPTSRWSATKKENRFSFRGNGIMSSFLGRQFYRSTLYLTVYKQMINSKKNYSYWIEIFETI